MSSDSSITGLKDIEALYSKVPYIGFLLNKTAVMTVQQVNAGLEPFGIRIQHYIGLLLLSQMDEPLPQKQIGEILRIDRNTMVSLTDTLQDLELVLRSRDPHDRRAYAISITDKGRELVAEAGGVVAQIETNMVNVLTEAELTQLSQMLLKLLR